MEVNVYEMEESLKPENKEKSFQIRLKEIRVHKISSIRVVSFCESVILSRIGNTR